MALLQIHHGIHVPDLARTKKALRAIGYTETQPGAPEPLEFRNVEGDAVGQQTAHALGDRYITHYIENPATGHRIDLIQIEASALQPRPSVAPPQGDLTIGLHMPDPLAAYNLLRETDGRETFSDAVDCPEEDGIRFTGCDGAEFIFTRRPDAFAIAHYSTDDFPRTKRFFEEILGFSVLEITSPRPDAKRYALEGCGGRFEFEVSDDVAVPDYQTVAKRYSGANHFRLLNIEMARVSERLAASPELGGFLLGPYENGFAFLYGPTNETPECFDMTIFNRAMAGVPKVSAEA